MKYFTDPKDGKPSVSLTLLLITFGLALVKVLLSDVTIFNHHLSAFNAGDFGILLSAPAALYFSRRYSSGNTTIAESKE